MYIEIQDFANVVDTVKQQSKVIEQQASMVCKLDELVKLQHIRISALEEQSDFLFKRICRIHKQIFWYLIAVIVVDIGGLIAFHMVTP